MIRAKDILVLLVFMICVVSCIEKFDFNVNNAEKGIVIEASISNQSYDDTRDYPSDGRYFSVRLARTSDVTNVRDEALVNADVALASDDGMKWNYTEDASEAGMYYLYDGGFKVQTDASYQLQITLASGERFESNWEQIPTPNTQLGELSINETSIEEYIYFKEDQRRLETFEGLDLRVQIAENDSQKSKFYRWTFEPIWQYVSPNLNVPEAIKTCWVRTPFYLNGYAIQEDVRGAYNQNLFFIRTKGNDRMYEYFSALVVQTEMTEGYYYFWKDLKAQGDKGGLFDQPPFGLSTNFTALNSEWTVNGYFGVVAEDAKRWVFNPDELSYDLVNNLYDLCQISYGPGKPGGPHCCDCRDYPKGKAVTQPPVWW